MCYQHNQALTINDMGVSTMAIKIIPPAKGLSDVFIKHLKPQDKRYDVADKSCAGLRVRVGTTGKKHLSGFITIPRHAS